MRAPRVLPVDLTMNLPPEPDDPALIARMQDGLTEISRDLVALLRYQGVGGSPNDKDAASTWLGRRALVPSQERLFITPGAHPALLGIFSILAKPGQVILSEELTYPGARSIASHLGLKLVGLPIDGDGIDPDALDHACQTLEPKALYLNPTLQNPTTLTIPEARRAAIVAVARRHRLPIVEDDAYGFIPAHGPLALAAMAPDITWHVAGLAKCIGAGLRIAYVIAPDARSGWPFASAVRSQCHASPLTSALAARWIEDGTADTLLRHIRAETMARQQNLAPRTDVISSVSPRCSMCTIPQPLGRPSPSPMARWRSAARCIVPLRWLERTPAWKRANYVCSLPSAATRQFQTVSARRCCPRSLLTPLRASTTTSTTCRQVTTSAMGPSISGPPIRAATILPSAPGFAATITGALKDLEDKPISLLSGVAYEKTKPERKIDFFTNAEGRFGVSGFGPGDWVIEIAGAGSPHYAFTLPVEAAGLVDLGELKPSE